MIADSWARMLRPACRAVGLCQVDGMPREPVLYVEINNSSSRAREALASADSDGDRLPLVID